MVVLAGDPYILNEGYCRVYHAEIDVPLFNEESILCVVHSDLTFRMFDVVDSPRSVDPRAGFPEWKRELLAVAGLERQRAPIYCIVVVLLQSVLLIFPGVRPAVRTEKWTSWTGVIQVNSCADDFA